MHYLLKVTLPTGRTLSIESIRIDQTYRGVLEGGTSPDTRPVILELILERLGGPDRVHLIEPPLTPLDRSFPRDHKRMPWYWLLLELTSDSPVSSMFGESCLSVLLFLDNPLDWTAIEAALTDVDWEKHARDCDLYNF